MLVLTAGGMSQQDHLCAVPGLVLSTVSCGEVGGALTWATGHREGRDVAFRGHPQSRSAAGLQQALGNVVDSLRLAAKKG